MDYYKNDIPILDDAQECLDKFFPEGASFGCIPRDYSVQPASTFGAMPSSMVLIPESEDDARFDEQEEQQSSLEHLYLRGGKPAFVNLNQASVPYCWTYSVHHGLMMCQLKTGVPIKRFAPCAVGAIATGGRSEGGWWGLSAANVREIGAAVEGDGPGMWPGRSLDLRNDTPALRAAMAAHKITEDFVDLSQPTHGQKLTARQYATCLLNNHPCPSDFMFWQHSVCAIRRVRIERGSWGTLILNSWENWGRFGLAVLRGSQAMPDGCGAILVQGQGA